MNYYTVYGILTLVKARRVINFNWEKKREPEFEFNLY